MMPTNTDLPEWMPRHGPAGRACGFWFDAAQLPSFAATPVIRRLGDRSGPVLEDQVAEVTTWLIPVGSATGWDQPAIEVLGSGRLLTIPPPDTLGRRVHWRIAPTGTCLTDPHALHDALRAVYGAGR
jgi:hypothetical protein